jgi:hypothetical protein
MAPISHLEDAQQMHALAESGGRLVDAMDALITALRQRGAGRRHLATITRLRGQLADLVGQGTTIADQAIKHYMDPAAALARAGGAGEVYDDKRTATRR